MLCDRKEFAFLPILREGSTINFMKQERILKYFHQKSHAALTFLSVVIMVVGFCLVWFFSRWALGLLVLSIGALLALFLALRIKDGEVDEAEEEADAEFRRAFEDKFVYGDARKFHQEELKGHQEKKPIYKPSFIVTGDSLLRRTGSDGKLRTSVYQSLGMIMTEEELYVGVKLTDLIDTAFREPIFAKWKFGELSGMEVCSPVEAHMEFVRLLAADGGELIRFQIPADAETDEILTDVNSRAKKAGELV